ncbi:MAG: PHP domain-containing protein [Anaerolineales bacterium]
MRSIPPFDQPGIWLRGNLHCHSRESDGALPPEEVLDRHRRAGYDFFALTDHDRITSLEAGDGSPVVLPGAELSLGRTRQGSPFHCIAVGLRATLPQAFPSPTAALAWVWDQGGFPIVAHPYWSGFSTDELATVEGVRAIEIYNHSCARENDKGHALAYWDDLLGRGRSILGVATDDAHWREPDFGGGWVMVRAADRSAQAVLDALRVGGFYSTGGPEISDIVSDGRRLRVRTTPAASIYWVGPGRLGWSRHAVADESLTEVEFQLKGNPDWVRVEVCDGHGRWAWSNSFQVPGRDTTR